MTVKQQEQMESVKSGDSRAFWQKITYFLFSCAATIGIFYYLLSKVSIGEVLQLVRELRFPAIIAFIFLSFSTSFFRAWRYLIVLEVSGVRPRLIPLFLVVIVRNLFSDLLPARIGTMIYIFLANTRLGVNWAAATSSFALAFLFDMLALIPLVMLAAWVAAGVGSLPFWPLLLGALIVGVIVVPILVFLPYLCGWLSGWLQQFPRLAKILIDMHEDLRQVQRQGLYLRLLLLSVMVRVGKYATYLVLLYALLDSLGLHLKDLHIAEAFLGIVASEIAASTPISGIGGFGVFEGTWVVVFRLLGLPERASELTAISHHLFTQVYGYGLGVLALLILLLPIFKVTEEEVAVKSGKASARTFYVNFVFSIMFITLLAAAILKLPSSSPAEEPSGVLAELPTKVERSDRLQFGESLPGQLVFDSNRSGTFGIYVIKTDGSEIKKLVDTEMHEMYPDVSASGKAVVYAKARSTARMALSDIWLLDLDLSENSMLAGNGTFPTFDADGKIVYFERVRRRVMAYDLEAKDEEEIFPAGNREFRRFQVVKPRVSPDGRFVAFTSNNPREWNAWYADLKTKEAFHIAPGCEPTWFPDSSKIAFIKMEGARDQSGIFSYDLEKKEIAELVDFDSPRGHEYFPTVHSNGQFIFYASSREGEHSHLVANYQLFVFDLARKQRVRLTFDAHTNRWPKFMP